ncbi:hypothetical protein K458DRAFT_196182 [Lentithecium fluviatile CBS 122367]|uniref:Protein kinase domain-containing protein n=1 Tax=Lentithecium fluviatile CBS 122367 TaxID=1168545 RepID=A0A6G1ICY0_9PLEO|nr:hypothetical protein K458DRAFT_196182 [Lentithecium fluviatile CBS 122367]
MSGLEIAGVVIGVVPPIFQAAGAAWKTLDDTITFDGDTEDLGIRLEYVKAHLGIWATKAGLTQGQLVEALVPQQELIARTLNRVRDLVEEVQQEGKKYGLVGKEAEQTDEKKKSEAVPQMRRSLISSMMALRGRRTAVAILLEKEGSVRQTEKNETKMLRRVLWAIHDKKRFEGFVESLEGHVKRLESFVMEGGRKEMRQEGTRFALEIIRGLSEAGALSQLQQASGWDPGFSQIDVQSLAQWKAIPLQKSASIDVEGDWSLDGKTAAERAQTRFIKRGRFNQEITYLFEKKEYDANISADNKDLLKERVRQLVALLKEPGAQRHLHTLRALGYVDDFEFGCWWVVFRFSSSPLSFGALVGQEPLSLRDLLPLSSKPPLEARYGLAKRLVDTFAQLYGADWMHKSINSRNIVFPRVRNLGSNPAIPPLQQALVQGFNYSRQSTQNATIDRGKVLNDLDAAIYRHPLYQGEAASGYKINYDIYSLGLVLYEIAVWMPLIAYLAMKPEKEQIVPLSPKMDRFHEAEAFELKRRVMIRVKHELAYRVGTKYKNLLEWCLNLEKPVTAVEFYDRVAVPLEDICGQL